MYSMPWRSARQPRSSPSSEIGWRGSGLDIDAIAAEVGYIDGVTLLRLGRGVRDLRADLC